MKVYTKTYKTEEGKKIIREICREIYGYWPIPAETVTLETKECGETHCLLMGPSNAPPLVLLHGASGNSAAWMGYVSLWAENFRVIAVDIPGQPGLSSANRPSLRDGGMRRWLHEVTELLGLGSIFLCGMSLGSWIAIDFSLAYPKRIRGVSLITSGGFVPPKAGFYVRILPLLLFGEWGAKQINRLIHGPVPVSPEVEEFSLIVSKYFIPLREKLPIFPNEALVAVPFPLLYIGGAKDVMLNTRLTARHIEELAPGAEIDVIPETGHVILDQGEIIQEFFTQRSSIKKSSVVSV